jgi:hypothetical protein
VSAKGTEAHVMTETGASMPHVTETETSHRIEGTMKGGTGTGIEEAPEPKSA